MASTSLECWIMMPASVGGNSSYGEVQPVGRLSVSGPSVRGHRLQAGHHRGPPAAERGRTVWTAGGLCSWRTGNGSKTRARTDGLIKMWKTMMMMMMMKVTFTFPLFVRVMPCWLRPTPNKEKHHLSSDLRDLLDAYMHTSRQTTECTYEHHFALINKKSDEECERVYREILCDFSLAVNAECWTTLKVCHDSVVAESAVT